MNQQSLIQQAERDGFAQSQKPSKMVGVKHRGSASTPTLCCTGLLVQTLANSESPRFVD